MYLCCHRYRNKEVEEHPHAPRDTFGRDAEGRSGPLIIEHDHGFRPRRNPSWERFDEQPDRGSAVGRARSFHPERNRMSGGRSDLREDASGRQGDGRAPSYPEPRRNLEQEGRKSSAMHSKHKGRAAGGRAGAPRSLEPSHGFLDLHPEPRPERRPFGEENHQNPIGTKAVGQEEPGGEPWTEHRARGPDPPPPDADPKAPRQRTTEWKRPQPKSVTVIAEETLTIKVDMNQPASKNR